MTTQNVKNNHESPIVVGNVLIPVGRTMPVPNWDRVKKTGSVKAFLEAGVISEDGKTAAPALPPLPGSTPPAGDPPPPPPVDGEDAEKESIIAELATRGIEKTKRTSLANLREALAEAKKNDAPPPGLPANNGA